MSSNPTAEQMAIIRASSSLETLRAVAFAGTGKTTTLRMVSSTLGGRGLYLAFNAAICGEAEKKFPSSVICRTAHGLAYRALNMRNHQHRLVGKVPAREVMDLAGIIDRGGSGFGSASIVSEWVSRFCNSAHDRLDERSAPEGMHPGLVDMLLPKARRLWEKMSSMDPSSKTPMTHDIYLKVFHLQQMREPTLGKHLNFILFDEAQDASPVMLDIVQRQGIKTIYVGDPHQSIYRFRGAVNAMRLAPGKELHLTKSFRFGEAIAEVANAILSIKPYGLRPDKDIIGFEDRDSKVGLSHGTSASRTMLFRTNSGLFEEAVDHRQPLHIVGGVEEVCRLVLAGHDLKHKNKKAGHIPQLAHFKTWDDLGAHAEAHDDRELKQVIKVVDRYGKGLPGKVADLKKRQVEKESDANLILSTAHKGKGKEWGTVALADDFPNFFDPEFKKRPIEEREDEINIAYVGASRAIDRLEPNPTVKACLTAYRRQNAGPEEVNAPAP